MTIQQRRLNTPLLNILLALVTVVGVAHSAIADDSKDPRLAKTTPTSSLWSMALQIEPEQKASLYQKLVALYQKNETAFINNDINKLKLGVQLLVPTEAEIQRYSTQQAAKLYASYLKAGGSSINPSMDAKQSAAKIEMLQKELSKKQVQISQSTENNQTLSRKLEKLESDAQSKVSELELKNKQLQSIQSQIKALESQLQSNGNI